jgi:parvulin-like peptidyl-prolyl isomerase
VSISRFQEKLFGKGCGTAILIGCAAVFGAFAFSNFGRANQFNGDQRSEQKADPVAVVVAGTPVTGKSIEDIASALASQYGMDLSSAPPRTMGIAYAMSFRTALGKAALPAVASQNGVNISDDTIISAIKQDQKDQLDQARVKMIAQKLIKPDATDKDFYAALSKQIGKDAQATLKAMMDQIPADLKDKQKRAQIIGDLGGKIIMASLEAKAHPSDADVKASYDQDTYKRVFLMDKPSPAAPLDQRLAAVEKDLKAGTDFDQLMDRYSEDPVLPKKREHDNTKVLTLAMLQADPNLKPLAALKVGQVSDPISIEGGKAIYKLISVKNNAPKDFDKNVARYREGYVKGLIESQVQNQVDDVLKTKTDWKSPGYKALYDASKIGPDAGDPQAQYKEAKDAVSKTSGFDTNAALLAQYLAFDKVWTAPGADQTKLRPERIEVLSSYLQNIERFDLRMDLVGLYVAEKDGADASKSLLQAAQENNDYDANGQRQFGDVAAMLSSLKSEKLIDPDTEKAIDAAQDSWKKEYSDKIADDAAKKAEEEADRKKALEEDKKDQKASKAAPSNSKPSGVIPGVNAPAETTPSTTPGTITPGGPALPVSPGTTGGKP